MRRQSLFTVSGERDEGVVRFEQQMQRLDDRVRRWTVVRWRAVGACGRPRATIAHELAATLAQLARQAGNGAPAQPPPVVQEHGVADQLVVLGQEFARAPEAAALTEAASAAVSLASESL